MNMRLFSLLNQDCFLDNDYTSLYHVAKGLMVLQALYGIIPNIYGKGHCAKVSDLIKLYFIIGIKHDCEFAYLIWSEVVLLRSKSGIQTNRSVLSLLKQPNFKRSLK